MSILNVFEFIKNNKYNIELGDWFDDIWYPLFEQKDLIITNKILYFIEYGTIEYNSIEFAKNKKKISKQLIDSLKQYKLSYKEIKYDDPVSINYKYIQNDIKKCFPK